MALGFVNKYAVGARLDGWDPDFGYQMVPQHGRRELIFETGKHPVMLSISTPAICIMRQFSRVADGAVLNGGSAHKQRLPANTQVKFVIEATSVGNTLLEFVEQLEARDGAAGAILISVKPLRAVTLAFAFLSDPIHQRVDAKINTRFMFEEVKQIYLTQANLELSVEEPTVPLITEAQSSSA